MFIHFISGNEKLHNLTKHDKYELRVNLKDWQNLMVYAVYTDFTVGDEESNYILSLGKYSGTAGMICIKSVYLRNNSWKP
jgi:hypothetical protein